MVKVSTTAFREALRPSPQFMVFVGIAIMLCLFVTEYSVTVGVLAVLAGAHSIGKLTVNRVVRFNSSDSLFVTALRTTYGLILVFFGALVLRPIISVRWTAGALLAFGLAIFFRDSVRQLRKRKLGGTKEDNSHNLDDSAAVFAIALLYLGRDFRWANTAFVGALVVLVGLSRYLQSTRVRAIFISAGSVIVLLSAATRTELWWFVSNDHHWFEAVGDSVTRFGPQDTLGINADVGLRYHFLAYVLSGGITDLFSIGPFVVITRVLPVLIAVAISATVWSLIGNFSQPNFVAQFLSAALLPFLFQYSHASPSHTLGVLLLLLLTATVLTGTFTSSTTAQVLFGIFVAASLSLAKASVVPPAVLGVLALLVLHKFRRRIFCPFWFGTTFVVVSCVYILWQLLSSRATSQIETGEIFGYAKDRMGDLRVLGYSKMGVVAMVLVTSTIFIPLVLAWRYVQTIFQHPLGPKYGECLVWFVAPTVIYGPALATLRGNHSLGYFVWAALYILSIPLLLVIKETIHRFIASGNLLKFVGSTFVVLVSVWLSQELLLPIFNGGARYEVLVRAVLGTAWLVPSLLLFTYWLVYRTRHREPVPKVIGLFVTWSVLIFVLPAVTSPYQLEKGPDAEPAEIATVLGSLDEIAVGEWINLNLSFDAVLATNHFCGSECAGSGWFQRDMKLPRKGFQLSDTPTQYGGANFFLAIYSQRRFLAQGTYHLFAAGSNPELLTERVESALEFVEKPTEVTRRILLRQGVTHIVVNTSVTSQRVWSPWAEILYSNSTFLVLSIKS